ncbi:hypothetical protein R3W88_014292 [Solanum pinnatisectum]|uniref:Uncharacterized protein n=1 Tax=Solanum pinnatisectum TaxID=50273 RepID=A0AAV9KTM2_9SOLN|nr:hypothetical protein R3W88_014292 [Solanum pinnatisectum]
MSDRPLSNAGSPTGPCTPDVSIGSSSCSSTSGRLVISKFVPNGHSITETFKERQDATGYHGRMSVNPLVNFIIARSNLLCTYLWNDKMEVVLAAAISSSSDDSEEVEELDLNQKIKRERLEAEVQQRLRQQSDDRFKSMEERWSRMMSVILTLI